MRTEVVVCPDRQRLKDELRDVYMRQGRSYSVSFQNQRVADKDAEVLYFTVGDVVDRQALRGRVIEGWLFIATEVTLGLRHQVIQELRIAAARSEDRAAAIEWGSNVSQRPDRRLLSQ